MKATCTASDGTTMVLHSASLHALSIDPLQGRSVGNWRSSWKRNSARSASGKSLSCKFLEAGKVFWLNIIKGLFLACTESQSSPWSLLRPTELNAHLAQDFVRPIFWYSVPQLSAFAWWREYGSVHKLWLWGPCGGRAVQTYSWACSGSQVAPMH